MSGKVYKHLSPSNFPYLGFDTKGMLLFMYDYFNNHTE